MKAFGEVLRISLVIVGLSPLVISLSLVLDEALTFSNDLEDTSAKIIPLHYTLRIRPVFSKSLAYAHIWIRIKAIQSSNLIELNQRDLKIDLDAVRVTNLDTGRDMDISSQSIETGRYPQFPPNRTNLYTIELKDTFEIGEQFEIYIPYKLEIAESWESGGSYALFGALSYAKVGDANINATTNANDTYFGVTTLAPYRARELFPLVDDPDLKSTFTIIIGREDEDGKYHVLSNTGLSHMEKDTENEGWVWEHFDDTVPLSPQHLLFLVSNFVNYTIHTPEDNRRISMWSFQSYMEQNMERVTFIAETTTKLLKFYENTFRMKYPSNKLDILRLPGHFANEAKGYYSIIVINREVKKTDPIEELVGILARDIAQQWFGVIIQSANPLHFSMSFFTEGIVQYVKSWGIRHILADYHFEQDLNWDNARYPENRLAALLIMLEDMLGRPIMEQAISMFVDKCKWKLAEDNDLYEAIQMSVEQNNGVYLLPSRETKIKGIITDWLHYPREEYPIVEVNVQSGHTLTISQNVFDPYKTMFENSEFLTWFGKQRGENSTWFLPVRILSGDNRTFKLWLPQNISSVNYSGNGQLIDTSKLVVVNPNGVPVYRTLYDPTLTQFLINQLDKDHNVLTPAARLQLFDDYIFFAHQFSKDSNYSFIEATLEMTKYLGKETSDSVWLLVLSKFVEDLITRFHEDAEAFHNLQKYFIPKMTSLISRLGSISDYKWGKVQQLCLQLRVPTCVKTAKELMTKWQDNPDMELHKVFPTSTSIHVSAGTWICTTISEKGNIHDWDFVMNQVRKRDAAEAEHQYDFIISNHHFEQRELLAGLACSKNTDLLSQFLEESLQMRNETRYLTFVAVANRPELKTKELMYEFLKEKVRSQQISALTFHEFMSQLAFSKRLKPEMWEDLQQFIDDNKELLEPAWMWLNDTITNFNRCDSCQWWQSIGIKAKTWLSREIYLKNL